MSTAEPPLEEPTVADLVRSVTHLVAGLPATQRVTFDELCERLDYPHSDDLRLAIGELYDSPTIRVGYSPIDPVTMQLQKTYDKYREIPDRIHFETSGEIRPKADVSIRVVLQRRQQT